MAACWQAHSKSIACMLHIANRSELWTGGQDGVIAVWKEGDEVFHHQSWLRQYECNNLFLCKVKSPNPASQQQNFVVATLDLNEKLFCLCSLMGGKYVLSGSASARIYLWNAEG
jgi:WD40 repeat protein